MSLADLVRVFDRWPSWIGDRSQFEELLASFDELASGDDPGDSGATRGTTRWSEATCVAGETREQRGDWRDLLDRVDAPAVSEFTIAVARDARALRGDLRLEFSRKQGVVLTANAAGSSLMEGSDGSLRGAIRSGVPWWAWLRSQIGGAVFAIVFACLVEGAALLLISDDSIVIVAALPIGFLIGYGIWALLGRRFPRFRILRSST